MLSEDKLISFNRLIFISCFIGFRRQNQPKFSGTKLVILIKRRERSERDQNIANLSFYSLNHKLVLINKLIVSYKMLVFSCFLIFLLSTVLAFKHQLRHQFLSSNRLHVENRILSRSFFNMASSDMNTDFLQVNTNPNITSPVITNNLSYRIDTQNI